MSFNAMYMCHLYVYFKNTYQQILHLYWKKKHATESRFVFNIVDVLSVIFYKLFSIAVDLSLMHKELKYLLEQEAKFRWNLFNMVWK